MGMAVEQALHGWCTGWNREQNLQGSCKQQPGVLGAWSNCVNNCSVIIVRRAVGGVGGKL